MMLIPYQAPGLPLAEHVCPRDGFFLAILNRLSLD
jgi:hypothetical protein